jgi:hypothetical protein
VKAVVDVEKSKVRLPENWPQLISAPDKRWRLIFTAGKCTALTSMEMYRHD